MMMVLLLEVRQSGEMVQLPTLMTSLWSVLSLAMDRISPDLSVVIIQDGAAVLFTDLSPTPSSLVPGPPTPTSTPVR